MQPTEIQESSTPKQQPVTSPSPKSSKKLVIIILITILLLLLFGGGVYYYFEIYRPAQYAKAAITLFEELESKIQTSQNQTLKDSKDYQGAIRIIQNQQTLLETGRDKLDSLKPPMRMQQLHQDFQKALDLLISASSDAQKITNFIIKANKLYNILKPEDEPKNPTVGQYINFWQDRITQSKTVAEDVFKEKPPQADKLQFDKLQSTWQEAKEGYKIVLSFLKKQDQNILVSSISETDISLEEQAKIRKIDEFLSLLEEVARVDAESLIKFYTIETLAGKELKIYAEKVSNGIRELKEKYQ